MGKFGRFFRNEVAGGSLQSEGEGLWLLVVMKLLVSLFSAAMLSCSSKNVLSYEPSSGDLRESCGFAGLAIPSFETDSLRLHPVTRELQKAGIRGWEGDHSERMTALYCLGSDLSRARALVAGLPAELRCFFMRAGSNERRGVVASVDEGFDAFDNVGFVIGVGNPKPGRVGFKHMAIDGASADEVVDDGRDVAFPFEFPALFVEEAGEVSLDLVDEAEREGPEVHGDDDVFFDEAGTPIKSATFDLLFAFTGDIDHFLHSLKEAIGGLADAPVDGPVIGKGADEVVAYEGVVCLAIIRVSGGEEAGGLLVGVGAIEVIGIDDRKRSVEFVSGSADGVGGAPWLFAAYGEMVSFRKVGEALKGVCDIDDAGEFVTDVLFEVFGKVFADDEDDFRESGTNGVKYGVVEDGLAMRTHGIHLFEAAVTASHSSCENDKCGRL